MRKIAEKIENTLIRAKLAMTRVAKEERGDTNFMSIAIVLVIVLALAAVFIAFGQKLLPKMQNQTKDILDSLG